MNVFFFNDTAAAQIYTLSLHDALPICPHGAEYILSARVPVGNPCRQQGRLRRPRKAPLRRFATCKRSPDGTQSADAAVGGPVDRKSTRLNSSHANISYAVFCLEK